ncbi:MAG: hypothetical protein AAFW46_04640 [Pseudomonadota bacterium]
MSFSVQILVAPDHVPVRGGPCDETASPSDPFRTLLLPRHGLRPLRVEGVVVAAADTRDGRDAPFWHELDLILTSDRRIAAAVRGRRPMGEGALRRCDAAFVAETADAVRAALAAHDPTPLAIAEPSNPDADLEARWEAYLDEALGMVDDYRTALARLFDIAAP